MSTPRKPRPSADWLREHAGMSHAEAAAEWGCARSVMSEWYAAFRSGTYTPRVRRDHSCERCPHVADCRAMQTTADPLPCESMLRGERAGLPTDATVLELEEVA